MRRLLIIILLLLTLPSFAVSFDDITWGSPSGTLGVVATDDALKNLWFKKIELESIISLEKNRTLEEQKKLESLETNLNSIEKGISSWTDISEKMNIRLAQWVLSAASDEIKKIATERDKVEKSTVIIFMNLAKTLDAGPFTEETTIADIQKEYPILKKIARTQVKNFESELEEAEKARTVFMTQKEDELKKINLEIERARFIKQTQLSKAIIKILTYIGIFLWLLMLRYITGKVLSRFQDDFSRPHKEAMWFIHRWSFRGIFLIAFLVLFSSEFSSFLPFIAIMSAAVGFALRDIVYSFIGWFMIGASEWYEEGDIIQIEDFQWRVFKITPLLTTLEERGEQGVTGRTVSFPNKVIFDKTITNFSRSQWYTFISIDFLITHDSNITHAQEMLMEIIGQQNLTLYYNSRNIINKLRYTYGYNESDVHPRIDIIVDPKGIILRAKVFVHMEKLLDLRTKISEEFCKKIRFEEDVRLWKS